jgi:hypothetical protein
MHEPSVCQQETLSTKESLDVLPERKKSFVLSLNSSKASLPNEGTQRSKLPPSLAFRTAVQQWWTGYTLTAKQETLQRLKRFLVANRARLKLVPKRLCRNSSRRLDSRLGCVENDGSRRTR